MACSPSMVFTDDIQKGPQRMPSKDHPDPGVNLYLSQKVSSLLRDSCLLLEKENPCQIQTSSSGSQLLAWEAFPLNQTPRLPTIASPTIAQDEKNKLYAWPPPHLAKTEAYAAVGLKAPPWPFCLPPVDSYGSLLVCWMHFSPSRTTDAFPATSYGRANAPHHVVFTG